MSHPRLLINWRAFEPKKNLLVLFEIGAYLNHTDFKIDPDEKYAFKFFNAGLTLDNFWLPPITDCNARQMAILIVTYSLSMGKHFKKWKVKKIDFL